MVETPNDLAQRLAVVQETIQRHAPDPSLVTLVAVTKTLSSSVVQSAFDLGVMDFGENYAQELMGKAAELPSSIRWHAIGPVQRNKVKKIARYVSLWHTVDRADLAAEIGKRAPNAEVLLQVNTTGEASKSGCEPAEVSTLADVAKSHGLRVLGLMTMGPTDSAQDPRPAFVMCKELADDLGLKHCSMGMSGDFATALEEGATLVRVGTAIFGPRE